MEKRMVIAGVRNIAGTSKKTGNRYSMFFATVLEPSVIQGALANACGYEAREIEVEEQVLKQLERETFPVDVTAFLILNRDNKAIINSVRMAELAKSTKPSAVA